MAKTLDFACSDNFKTNGAQQNENGSACVSKSGEMSQLKNAPRVLVHDFFEKNAQTRCTRV
jgi:hypothetical protein